MKICAISDIHGKKLDYSLFEEADLLIIAGDVLHTRGMDIQSMETFTELLNNVQHRYDKTIFVPGNHDVLYEKTPKFGPFLERISEKGFVYLVDRMYTYKGKNIWGHPWTINRANWAFQLENAEIRNKVREIPNNVDILVSHGPPHQILDYFPMTRESVGCPYLTNKIVFNMSPELVICGHIHEGHGEFQMRNTRFYNVSMCDDEYEVVHGPTYITLD